MLPGGSNTQDTHVRAKSLWCCLVATTHKIHMSGPSNSGAAWWQQHTRYTCQGQVTLVLPGGNNTQDTHVRAKSLWCCLVATTHKIHMSGPSHSGAAWWQQHTRYTCQGQVTLVLPGGNNTQDTNVRAKSLWCCLVATTHKIHMSGPSHSGAAWWQQHTRYTCQGQVTLVLPGGNNTQDTHVRAKSLWCCLVAVTHKIHTSGPSHSGAAWWQQHTRYTRQGQVTLVLPGGSNTQDTHVRAKSLWCCLVAVTHKIHTSGPSHSGAAWWQQHTRYTRQGQVTLVLPGGSNTQDTHVRAKSLWCCLVATTHKIHMSGPSHSGAAWWQ